MKKKFNCIFNLDKFYSNRIKKFIFNYFTKHNFDDSQSYNDYKLVNICYDSYVNYVTDYIDEKYWNDSFIYSYLNDYSYNYRIMYMYLKWAFKHYSGFNTTDILFNKIFCLNGAYNTVCNQLKSTKKVEDTSGYSNIAEMFGEERLL